MGDGTPFPGRDLAVFLASGVILLSLVLATLALPHALLGLQLPADPQNPVADNRARIAGAHAAIRAIEADRQASPASGADGSPDADAAERIVALYRQRIERYQDNSGFAPMPGGVDDAERRLRLLALHAEREEIVRSASDHGVKEADQRKLVREIDLQEARYSA